MMEKKTRKKLRRLVLLPVLVWMGISIGHNFGSAYACNAIYEGKTHLALKVIRSPLMNVNAYDGPILLTPVMLFVLERRPVTPLETACCYGDLMAVKALMERGANPNKGYRTNALKEACANHGTIITRNEIVKLIIDDAKDVNAYEKTSWTPLFSQVRSGNYPASMERDAHINIICLLMDHGAHTVSPRDGETVMHLAAEKNNVYLLEVFVDRYGLEIDMRNGEKSTPLMYVAENGAKEAVEYLLEHGADKTATNWIGETAYRLAVTAGHDDIAQLLEP